MKTFLVVNKLEDSLLVLASINKYLSLEAF